MFTKRPLVAKNTVAQTDETKCKEQCYTLNTPGVTTHRERSLQLAGDCAEAVEHKVFSHTVDPLTTGRQRATHEVATFSFTGAEAPHDLHREVEHTDVQAAGQQRSRPRAVD